MIKYLLFVFSASTLMIINIDTRSLRALCLSPVFLRDDRLLTTRSTIVHHTELALHQLNKFFLATSASYTVRALVIERTFGSAELFGRTSTVRFCPNDRTFFCRTQNFFLYYIQCQWHPFILLFCLTTNILSLL